jgi:hypothetical protein
VALHIWRYRRGISGREERDVSHRGAEHAEKRMNVISKESEMFYSVDPVALVSEVNGREEKTYLTQRRRARRDIQD